MPSSPSSRVPSACCGVALPLVFLEVNYYEEMALFPSVYQFLYDLRRATLSRPLAAVQRMPRAIPPRSCDVRLIDAR